MLLSLDDKLVIPIHRTVMVNESTAAVRENLFEYSHMRLNQEKRYE